MLVLSSQRFFSELNTATRPELALGAGSSVGWDNSCHWAAVMSQLAGVVLGCSAVCSIDSLQPEIPAGKVWCSCEQSHSAQPCASFPTMCQGVEREARGFGVPSVGSLCLLLPSLKARGGGDGSKEFYWPWPESRSLLPADVPENMQGQE